MTESYILRIAQYILVINMYNGTFELYFHVKVTFNEIKCILRNKYNHNGCYHGVTCNYLL